MPTSKLPQPRTEYTETLRHLPYRPTFKLTRVRERPYFGHGWKTQAFKDARGNRYERDRDGQWERWSLVLERRRGNAGRVLYAADLKRHEPEEHADCLDRIDDLVFAASSLVGLVDDALERGLFPKIQLDRLRRAAVDLMNESRSLEPNIAEATKNGHA